MNKRLFYLFDNARYITKDGKKIKGLHNLSKKQREELGKDLDSPELADANRVKDYRRILTAGYNMAKKSGIDVAPFEKNYFPLVIRSKIFRTLRDDLYKIIPKDERMLGDNLSKQPALEDRLVLAMKSGELSPDTISALKHVRKMIEKQENKRATYAEAFQSMRDEVFSEFIVVNKNLELSLIHI